MMNLRMLAQLLGPCPAPVALWGDWLRDVIALSVKHPGNEALAEDTLMRRAEEAVAAAGGDLEAAIDRRRERAVARQSGAVAVIPIQGVIIPKRNILEAIGLAISGQTIVRWTRQAMADADVKAVIWDINSPGGAVAGTGEAFEELIKLRGEKPIIAQSNFMMASGAYYLGVAADEIAAAPSALTGSIGVVLLHMDYSKMLEAAGVEPTFIFAGQHKVEGNPYQPLSDEAREHFQGEVDDAYAQFVSAVARGRGVTPATVRGQAFGQGRVLTSSDALAAGMIDKIRTLDQTLEAYGVGAPTPDSRGAVSAIERRRRELDFIEQ